MNIVIRETNLNDYSGIYKLLDETGLLNINFNEINFNKFLNRNKGFCFVAEIDGRLAGNIFGAHDGAFTGHISKLAVRTKFRRLGIANNLVNEVVKAFDNSSINLKFAHTQKDNLSSIKLFNKLGFSIRDTHLILDLDYKAANPK